MSRRPLIATVAAVALAVTACSTTPAANNSGSSGGGTAGAPAKVSLQLQWVTQGQFAGYFAAVDQGFYKDAGLDVTILEGGVDIVPQTVLAQGQADYAIAWVPKALASRASRARGSPTSRRSSSAPAPGRCRSRPRTSPRPPTSRARRSATGASATSSSCSPA